MFKTTEGVIEMECSECEKIISEAEYNEHNERCSKCDMEEEQFYRQETNQLLGQR